ncbi:cytidylate kinase [Tannerella sp. oral taxon 808]|nr:cytidylate kinase [Tannerella sp. oral taxon 808]
MKKIIVAIDGLSSCGKSTMARELAQEVGYTYIDTGAMYRAVTLYALRHGLLAPNGQIDTAALEKQMGDIRITFRVNPATGRSETCLNGEQVEAAIRGMEVSAQVSRIASLPFVRRALVAQQQAMGRQKGVVMDGRDIGTVVFPEAELKIFVTATDEVRAQRRVDELRAKGTDVSMEEVLRNVRERDRLDMERAESPLRRADDAIELDNTHLTIPEQRALLLRLFHQATEG